MSEMKSNFGCKLVSNLFFFYFFIIRILNPCSAVRNSGGNLTCLIFSLTFMCRTIGFVPNSTIRTNIIRFFFIIYLIINNNVNLQIYICLKIRTYTLRMYRNWLNFIIDHWIYPRNLLLFFPYLLYIISYHVYLLCRL